MLPVSVRASKVRYVHVDDCFKLFLLRIRKDMALPENIHLISE